jgi:hypothetical protein
LTGAQGFQGFIGSTGAQGVQGYQGFIGSTGAQGLQGLLGSTGYGLISGGATGQYITKVDGTDFNVQWSDLTIGIPTDATYTDGFFDYWTYSTPVPNAMDDINEVIRKLAPAQPPSMTTKSTILNSSYGSTTLKYTLTGVVVSNSLVTDLTTTDVTLSVMTTTSTGGGFKKEYPYYINAVIDNTIVGTISIANGDITAPYPATTTTTNEKLSIIEYDYWGGVSGKEAFWPAIVCQVVDAFSGITNGTHSVYFSYTNGLTIYAQVPSVVYCYDNPIAMSNTLLLDTFAAGNRYISGVPSLATNDNLSVTYSIAGLITQVYRSAANGAIAITSTYATQPTITLTGTYAVGATVSGGATMSVLTARYVENIIVSFTGTNAKGTTTTNTNLLISTTRPGKTMRVDTVSTEVGGSGYTNRLISGGTSGNFPITYGSAFGSTNSLLTGNYLYELQMLNGSYRRISGNYTSNFPIAGPDYSSDTNTGYRWLMFTSSYSSPPTITINGTNFSSDVNKITDNMKIYCKVEGSTGWLDCNAAYPGVGNPINDGDKAMLVATSTATSTTLVKKITFGTNTFTTQPFYVRIGMSASSNDTISSVTVT